MPQSITPAVLNAANQVEHDLGELDVSTRALLTLLRAQDTQPPTGGGGGPVAYSHYRLLIGEVGGSAVIRISEITLHSEQDGADLATGGTPTASAVLSSQAVRAFDNNQSSYWQASADDPVADYPLWIAYELTTPAVIVEYTIQKYFSNNTASPKSWDFQGSNDGSTWETLASESEIVWAGDNYETKTFTSA